MDSRRRIKLASAMVGQLVLLGAMLFLPAGTFHWTRAWVFLGIILCLDIALLLGAVQIDPGLVDERTKSFIQKGQPLSDQILVSLFVLSYFAATIFAPLDLFHLHLMRKAPLAVAVLGLILFVIGIWIGMLATLANRYASPAVRHQEERGQTVIQTGVYARVRHPMYAGFMAWAIGLPLWLGSYAATLAALVPCLLLATRLLFEEQFLRRTLAGYEEYMRRVRYRLIPGIW